MVSPWHLRRYSPDAADVYGLAGSTALTDPRHRLSFALTKAGMGAVDADGPVAIG